MTAKEYLSNNIVKEFAKGGLVLVIIAALTLEATSIIQFYFSQKGIKEEARMRAESEMAATELKILNVVDQAESAVRNSIWVAQWCLAVPDSLQAVARRIVADNPVVVGSTVALVPGYNRKRPLYAPYCYKMPGSDSLCFKSLATKEYDYPSQEWFSEPVRTGKGYWSEPYIDEGGGDMLMTTYSVPILDRDGETAAVLTADISLDWLTDLVGGIKVYPNAVNLVVSRAGQIMVCPAESLVMRRSFMEVATRADDTSSVNKLGRSMMNGDSGQMVFKQKGKTYHVFFAPVERTGWSISIFIPDSEIFGSIKRMGMLVKLLQLLGIAMLILILRAVAKNQVKYQEVSENKERMEKELQIASGIQMSMVPKIFPPFPERHDLDMYGAIIPAKEVGGDLYDFFIRDEKLFFCIGDVSGKGVPASLLMAVTRSLFRTVAGHESSPQRIVSTLNDSMSDMNDNNMFVTFFCGSIDLLTGHMRYCNAGHNAPLILQDEIKVLTVDANLPLGVLPGYSYTEQECDLNYDDALFVYTDGVSEAENIHHELFGERRMRAVLRQRRSSKEHLDAMERAVSAFVGEAPQSDDITMLFIHFMNDKTKDERERHLILHNDIQQIPQLAEFIETIAQDKHLDQSLAMSLNLALEEAVSNVIMYAYPEGADGLVDIEAVLRDKSLEFIISDSGSPFDPTAAPVADTSLDVSERQIGGLGIYLVRNIMDRVEYRRENGKNILSMTKNI